MRRNKLLHVLVVIMLIAVFFGVMELSAAWFSSSSKDKDSSETVKPIEDQPFTFSTFRKIAQASSASVVNISTTTILKPRFRGRRHRTPFEDLFGDDFFFHFFNPEMRSRKIQSLGSGVIIDKDGYILTNHHVIEDVDEIQITTLEGKSYDAKVIGSDPQTDIGLIKIDTDDPLKPIPMGDSDAIQVGDWVMAIGNPFGFGHTVTVGVVSAKGRSLVMPYDELPYQDFIQTDASINPGNSGGPLLDIHGRLIGINSVIASRTGQSAGIGFAIPINMIKAILPDLKENGSVTRGWLGVTIQSLDDTLAESMGLEDKNGALVSEVVEDGPADKGGLKVGDVILEYNGKKIKDSSELSRLVAVSPVGSKAYLTVFRNGKTKEITVKLGERPQDIQQLKTKSGKTVNLGMTVQDLTPDIARQLGISDVEGVLISDVDPGTPADKAGLQRGDVILEVNQKKVKNLKDYKDAIADADEKHGIVLYIQRGDSRIFVAIRVKEND